MLAQSLEASGGSSLALSPGQGHKEVTGLQGHSPLSQAMRHIHSPGSMSDITSGEGVVLQMEEGRATLIATPKLGVGEGVKVEPGRGSNSHSGSDCDDVFDNKSAADKMEAKTGIESAISNIMKSRTDSLNQDLELTRLKNVGDNVSNFSGSEKSVHKRSPTILVSPTASLTGVSNKHSVSPKGRKRSGDVSIAPRPTSIVSPALSPAYVATTVSSERKRSTSRSTKQPHPAFNIPAASLEKMNSGMYNYNLPDRGLGSMMSPVSVAVALSTSPPSMAVPRFPVSAPVSTVASQIMGLTAAGWPLARPVMYSNSPGPGDSAGSGSPLDLSSVRESSPKLVKNKPDDNSSKTLPGAKLSHAGAGVASPPSPLQLKTVSEPCRGDKNGCHDPTVNRHSSPSPRGSTSPAAQNKAPYVQEMLYLFNKELEIISVGKNKWIVRNEHELVNVVRDNTSPTDSLSPTSNASSCLNCQKLEHSCAKLMSEVNKRGCDLEAEGQNHRAKITKVANGDVHQEHDGKGRHGDQGSFQTGSKLQTVSSNVLNNNNTSAGKTREHSSFQLHANQ